MLSAHKLILLIYGENTNVDVFAWEPSQMPGIPREVIEHNLRIYPDATLVRQKPRKQSVERQNFIREEVRKLLHAGFIEEVHHSRVVGQPGRRPKGQWEASYVHRLHQPHQGVS